MRRIAMVLVAFAVITTLMFAEYRYIMCCLRPYYADGYVYIDFMGQTDVYNVEPIE